MSKLHNSWFEHSTKCMFVSAATLSNSTYYIRMISFLVIWVSTFFKDWIKLHEEIGGRWHVYLWNLFVLMRFRRGNPKGRLDLHNIWDDDDLRNMGVSPFPQEIEYCNPKQNQGEDLFIYGLNTGEKTTVEVYFKRRPLPRSSDRFDSAKDKVEVKFRLDDGKGNLYWMDEESVVEFSANEYRASGFAFETMQANKTGRIKFRGYLRRNDEDKLYYVQIRFLCLFFSKTIDHQRSINESYLAKELSNESISRVEDLLEDKIEQFCQIKGTFKVESDEESELFFLGTVGRRFLSKNKLQARKVVKICGYDKEGRGFQLGLIKCGAVKYRYGFMCQAGKRFHLLENLSLTDEVIERLSNLTPLINSYEFDVKFTEDEKNYKFVITRYKDNVKLVKIDGVEGMCFVDEQEFGDNEKEIESKNEDWETELSDTLVVPLDKDCARVVQLTGGKGASLAQLRHLSKDTEWTVPNAVVVTTSAYRVQTGKMTQFRVMMKNLEKEVIARNNVEKECEKMRTWFETQKINDKLNKEIEKQMENEFGSEWQEKLYAVRSSASNEDSSEMSSAGQMTTYLGVRGMANLSTAVVKCWASQFGFVPIEYKRGYGQELNAPMAVVIQEMVDCDSAGVIFTANPTNGDERILTVTSNFGLGESVVSASADPDTFQLAVDIRANSYESERKVTEIITKTLGKKSLVTKLNQDVENNDIVSGVLNEQFNNGAQQQSLGDEDVVRLGNIALGIQQHYGNPRDIEWGLKNDRMYIFQSRPITNLDSTFTNYELIHEMDTPHMSEFEIYSRAHWGENFPGSTSWAGGHIFLNGFGWTRNQIRQGSIAEKDYNPYKSGFAFMWNQLMFTMRGGPFEMFFRDYPSSDFSVAQVFGFFGRHITDPDVLDAFKQIRANSKPQSLLVRIIFPLFMFYFLVFNNKHVQRFKKRVFGEENYGEIVSKLKEAPLKDKQNIVLSSMSKLFSHMILHGMASMGSTVKSMMLMKLLKRSTDTSNVESDYNLLLSCCNDVVSAEVPNMLRQIAKAIENKQTFAQLTDQEALEVLQSTDGNESKASELFAQFLQKHGHRGYREFDPLHMPWGKKPLPCVQVVKSLLKGGASLEPKQEKPIEEIMSEIKTPLNWFTKLLIEKWLLSWCRDAVGQRENTKSIFVKIQDHQRDALWYIGNDLVEHGILPEQDLIFYLRIDETQRLLSGERNPLLVMKARQRKRLYPEMNKLKFDEFVKGFRMRPRDVKKETIHIDADSVCLRGTAVTVGDVKARVCVAESIEEADNIQQGDILVTYSTDIGWSPYFPLISGIVTEIGGTISHGAVIAREFGIPCLIAVDNACSHFQTGDMAYLDTKTTSIVKVKQ